MTEPVLSARALNRALLARQLLLERCDLSPPEVLERVGGLQTQYAPSGYIGLWTRVRDFARPSLTRALEERRVVQGTVMRATIHMVSAHDYWPFVEGVRRSRRRWWLSSARRQLDGVDMEAVAARLRDALAGGPRRRSDLVKLLEAQGYPAAVWQGAGFWVDMLRVPPSGTWERRRADLYALAEQCLDPTSIDEDAGIGHLVRRYLGGFGPATVNDIASWAGLAVQTVRAAVAGMDLRLFRDQEARKLLDLPDAPLPDPEAPVRVRFLPAWEAALLAHARRKQVLPEQYRSLVFNTRTPQSLNTFLVDGSVAGTWHYADRRIVLQPFDRLPRAVSRELEEEAEALAAFHS